MSFLAEAARMENGFEKRPKEKKKPRVSPAGCRRKGSKFESDIAKRFKIIYDYDGDRIRRGNQTRFGHDGADVETPHFWVECKNQARPNIKRALEQAKGYCVERKEDRWPVAVTKGFRGPTLVTMYFDDFEDLVRQLYSGEIQLKVPEDF